MALSLKEGLEVHDALQALLPRVREQKVWLREATVVSLEIAPSFSTRPNKMGVSHDRAVCGLVVKAALTHSAIGLLAHNSLLGDALALCRVLLENAMTLSWVIRDPTHRLDHYCAATELYRRRLWEVVIEHYDYRPDLVETAKRRLADEDSQLLAKDLGHDWEKWAVRRPAGPGDKPVVIGARGIFRDLGAVSASGERQSFAYDVPYFDWSHHIHSTAQSLIGLVHEDQQYLSAEALPPSQVRLSEAVNAANLFLAQVLGDLVRYSGVDLDPEFEELWARIRRDVPEDLLDSNSSTTRQP